MTESVPAPPLVSLDPQDNVFLLVELDKDDELECIGTAVAISRNLILTTWKNGMFWYRSPPSRFSNIFEYCSAESALHTRAKGLRSVATVARGNVNLSNGRFGGIKNGCM